MNPNIQLSLRQLAWLSAHAFSVWTIALPQTVSAQQKLHISDKDDVVKEIANLLQKGNLEAAKQVLDRNIAKNPKDADLRMFLGKYYVLKQQYDKARFELNKAVEYNPGNVDAKQLLVTVETETKRFSSAICYVNELLEVNPYWRGLWRKKIELYRLQGNHVEADRLLTRISQIFPDDKEIQDDRVYRAELSANSLRKSGRVDDAIEINKLLLQERPNQLDLYFDLINSYIKTGDYSSALSTADRGLNSFPNNPALVDKKISILEHNKRYDEILSLLQSQMKGNGAAALQQKYNYFLLEAARYAKSNDPAVLYGKILAQNPGNEEAFQQVLTSSIALQQYDEALSVLHRYMQVRGYDKNLALKELEIYRLKGDQSKVRQLTKSLYYANPKDADLQASYVVFLSGEARDHMFSQEYDQALPKLQEIMRLGDSDQQEFAMNSMYNAYLNSGHFSDALMLLKDKIRQQPANLSLQLKLADLYERQEQYESAAEVYEQLMAGMDPALKENYLSGYRDLSRKLVKAANEEGQHGLAYNWAQRWLKQDPQNKEALSYAINLAHQLQDKGNMLRYAQQANTLYPHDINLKLKLLMAHMANGQPVSEGYDAMNQEMELYPFNDQVRLSFVQFSKDYAQQLWKDKENERLLQVLNKALTYQSNDKEMKYLKGLAFEKLKQYDSAYYYQQYYEPSALEISDYRAHMNFLYQQGLRNEVGIYHLRTRFGDQDVIQSISTVEYSRKGLKNSYVGRVNYTGREGGKGIQGQVEWSRAWNAKWASRVDLAISNKFFPEFAGNISLTRYLASDWELEAAAGYRKFFTEEQLYNAVLGVSKEVNNFRLSAKYTQFSLEGKLLFNMGLQGRYAMNNTKNYLLAMANMGNSPDVDLLNYQYVQSFSVANTMLGLGGGHMINKNISLGILGTWYNFETDPVNTLYRNLYNLYFQVHVAF